MFFLSLFCESESCASKKPSDHAITIERERERKREREIERGRVRVRSINVLKISAF